MTALGNAAEKYASGDPAAKPALSTAIKGVIDLYTDHIWRDDYLLFPMTEKVLPKTELDGLKGDFNEVEMRFGSDFHRKYEQFVERLEQSFAVQNKGDA